MKFEWLTANYDDCPPDQAPTFFGFSCPKRDFMCTGLLLRNNPEGRSPPGHTWEWNGDRERPTFTPSINCTQCSHGFITDGVWRDA